MEFPQKNSCSVIQYYRGNGLKTYKVINSNILKTNNSVEQDVKEVLTQNNGDMIKESTSKPNHESHKVENSVAFSIKDIKQGDIQFKEELFTDEGMGLKSETTFEKVAEVFLEASQTESKLKVEPLELKSEPDINNHSEMMEWDEEPLKRGRKRKLSETATDGECSNVTNPLTENVEANDGSDETDYEDEEEMENKPRKRGRCKKNPDIIPSHLSSDVGLGYKILLKFLETPQFSGFHKPFKKSATESVDNRITCLNQIKKKFENNSYNNVCDFVNDVREMLINIYESRNPVATKRALRLEQILEQRIAQLPNYLRPQCALVLPPEEVNNSVNKIRISKSGEFVSLLLEKTERERSEKNREKRKLLAEERKQMKEEQDKDVQEWEKNVLLKDVEEEIKSMWELPAIGHFIHLCSDLLNVGEVAQYEVERMLLMPQCSETLDLVMTSLLTNSLVRAKLDRTPPMPYSIWAPLVRTRVVSWYRLWHRENRNEQKLFEEIGVEPDFWQILGPDKNPLDFNYFHELSLFQRVWVLKTLCDVDFVRKKTVHDNIRAQPLDELNPVYLGVDRHGNRYVQLKQFGGTDVRIYRQSVILEDEITPSELVESHEGFEHRAGAITSDKLFKDIWDLPEKPEVKYKKKKSTKHKKVKSLPKVAPPPVERKNLRKSVRAKQKTYADWSDSDMSDTDLSTLRDRLRRSDPESLYRPFSDREFISLSVFRLPREKVSSKPTGKRNSTASKRTEDNSRSEGTTGDKTTKLEPEERKEDAKPGCEDEQSDSLEAKPNQEIQNDFDKSYQGDEDDDSEEKDDKFSVKMMLNKGDSGDEATAEAESSSAGEDIKPEKDVKDIKQDSSYKYNIPNHLKPDSNKFYLVVDSVEGLRQLISKFGSHENDLEIITRSTKARRKKRRRMQVQKRKTSCEVKLIERLQKLLVEMEPLELDLMKAFRSNREKMYKEYMNFINRPPDFVHPNEAYWMKNSEEPASSTASTTTAATTVTATAADGNGGNLDKSGGKENGASAGESVESNQLQTLWDELGPRKRTRVTRLQLHPENNDLDEDSDYVDDCDSNGSDDVWVLPTPKKKAKREATPKTPKLPKRYSARRTKSSPSEKAESQPNTGEKSNSSPEKSKKALFWGQRSSDPSEDLNWETNRQKILEQHNSPIKKLLFGQKPEESSRDTTDPQNVFHKKSEYPTTSVITAPPKRFFPQIPGNKKPYFSSAQLKAMDNQRKLEEQQRALAGISSPRQEVKTIVGGSVIETTSPDGAQSLNKTNKMSPKQPTANAQSGFGPRLPTPKPTISRPESTILHQTLTQPGQIKVQNSGQLTNVIQSVSNSGIEGGGIQQNPISQAQHLQPVRIQQIQVKQPSGQARAVTGTVTNVKMQQPIQWQSKMITLHTIDHTGKVVQQQRQVQNQGQAQDQGSSQQAFHVEPSASNSGHSTILISAEKLASLQQKIAEQNEGKASDCELYITDGKLLIKFDNDFVQEYLIKDKVVASNDKLDLKKPLFIVKPKPDADADAADADAADEAASQSEPQPSTSQQNILVINEPRCVEQSVVTSTVPSFVIPGNYIIKDGSQTQSQGTETQTVKIVQPASAYVIQQKPMLNKDSQPQIFKIITSQPVASNQNIILSSANLNLANQLICPVNQTVVTSDQQTKALATIRIVRPQVAVTSPGTTVQNKGNLNQSPIIVNNALQIQGSGVGGPRSQATVLGGRIVSTEVPSVRLATPTVVQSSSPQTVRLVRNQNVQPLRITTAVQSRPSSSQIAGTQPAGLTTVISAQPLRLATSLQGQTVVSSSSLNPQAVASMNLVQTIPSSSQHLLTQTVVSSAGLHAENTGPKSILTSQPVASSLLSAQPIPTSSSFIANSEELETATIAQSVRNITSSQPETVLASSSQAIRVVTIAQPQQIYTSAIISTGNTIGYVQGGRGAISTIVQAVRPAMSTIVQPTRSAIVQPVRLASGGQPQTIKIIQNNSPGIRFVNINAASAKATVITNSASSPSPSTSGTSQPVEVVTQPIRVQTIVRPGGVSRDGGLHLG